MKNNCLNETVDKPLDKISIYLSYVSMSVIFSRPQKFPSSTCPMKGQNFIAIYFIFAKFVYILRKDTALIRYLSHRFWRNIYKQKLFWNYVHINKII